MLACQSSCFGAMLSGLPAVLTDAGRARATCTVAEQSRANRLAALSSHAGARVLTKLGLLDLAWIAAQHGLQAAEASGDEAVIGSLRRSIVHTLQANGQSHRANGIAGGRP